MAFLHEAAVFLTAAVIAVPVAKRLGLGAILGYLAAGAVIGPQGARPGQRRLTISSTSPSSASSCCCSSSAWSCSRAGCGRCGKASSASAACSSSSPAARWRWSAGCFGLGPAGRGGRRPDAVAVVDRVRPADAGREEPTDHPARARRVLDPAAAGPGGDPAAGAGAPAGAGRARAAAKRRRCSRPSETLAILIATAVAGRFFLRYALRVVAGDPRAGGVHRASRCSPSSAPPLLMEQLGLSAALGAFLAGVLLADSEYRHELQADVEPFKGLLLGLFFIAVGMSLNMQTIVREPGTIGAAGGRSDRRQGRRSSIALGRANGLGCAVRPGAGGDARRRAASSPSSSSASRVEAQIITRALADRLIAAVTLSLVATPLLFAINGAIERREAKRKASETPTTQLPGDESQVIIAGFGRFGQIVARILRAKRIPLHRPRHQLRAGRFRAQLRLQGLLRRRLAARSAARPRVPTGPSPSCSPSTTSPPPCEPPKWCASTSRT